MNKKLAVFLVLLFSALIYGSPALACEANCGGNSCKGTGDCHCDPVTVGGSTILVPHCTDASTKVDQEYIDYLRTWNLPGLNRMADSAEDMMKAIEANDLAAYQRALEEHNRAESALSKTERQIYRGFDRPEAERTPREK